MAASSSRSPLVRSGATQAGRDAAELDPAFFRIDERELADLVLYARALSREIAYYGPDNQPDDNWEPFFASDVTAILASLARLPVESFRTALADAEEFLKDDENRAEGELRAYFNLIFHLPVALFAELARAHALLARDHPVHGLLMRLVEDDLAGPLTSLLRYYKGATAAGMPLDPESPLVETDYGTGAPADERPRLSDTVAAAVFVPEVLTQRPIAGPATEALGAADWVTFAAGIAGDSTPYQQAPGTNLYEQIYDALTYNLLVRELERVFQALARARAEAQAALERSLTEVDDHSPHYGLFLAFLDMLAVARGKLNGMTARHLDFYYREVLRMSPRAPVPDSVHVLFELAKGTDAHLVGAGTHLRAGKDDTGTDVRYRLADDIVVNRGKVAELRAIRVHSVTSGGDLHQTVFASPVANSADGLGADLPEDVPAWRPFGPKPYPKGKAGAQAPFARVGFAVADRKLFLREGQRLIFIGFALDAPLTGSVIAAMRVRLTTAKGWLETKGMMLGPFFGPNLLAAYFWLEGDAPPVMPFDPEIHGDDDGAGYVSGLPVAELVFDFKTDTDFTARSFALLRSVRIQESFLVVLASGLRSLSFLTPDGAADPSKPFPAFGARPKTNSPLIIGSSEIFAKPLAGLNFHVTWDEMYSKGGFFRDLQAAAYDNCDLSYLSKGKWTLTPDKFALKLNKASPTLSVGNATLFDGMAEMKLEDPVYSVASRNGFIRVELGNHFGHQDYPAELTRATIAMASEKMKFNLELDLPSDEHAKGTVEPAEDGTAAPKPPYTPTIREITASYGTTGEGATHFFHVAPFGQALLEAEGATLLPPLDYEAALFVGIENFEGPARLSLLAQVANGSGDPLLEVPELAFDYLAGDTWKAFAEQDVDDKTGNFASSAVLGFALPQEADARHELMPDGLHWLRISAAQNAAAVNSLIAIEAQAVRAQFQDRGNDPQFLAKPLPPGTISKLAVPDPRIKKTRQPFASFGGRPEEDLKAFRRRSSERLRHKDRASTMWDYERLALEAAPELYRVKCLNHTELVRENGKIVADDELSPGGVVVVTVPWTTGRPHLDPLRPYTDQATLKKVRDLLSVRVSPFVRLEVANPKFEEVQVKFKVAFLEGIDDVAFYLGELDKAVIGYLAPWSVGNGADITFGGKLRQSSVIDFVEELPYVDFLEDFEMYHRPNPDVPAWTPVNMETIEATTARSILVSAPHHIIQELD